MRTANVAGAWTRRAVGLAIALACGLASVSAHATRIDASFQRGGLQLRFSEPMRVWDNPRSDGLVRLQPDLPATCNWSSDLSLDCDFGDAEPALATRYRIHIAAGLTTQRGATVPVRVLTAETARPTLHASVQTWRAGVPVVRITSDQPVTAAAVTAVLRAHADGTQVALPPPLAVPTQSWERGSRFELDLSAIADAARVLELSVVPGLRGTGGPLPGTQAATLLALVPGEGFRLRGGDCAGRRGPVAAKTGGAALALDCVPGEPVRLSFSGELEPDARERFVAALPPGVRFLRWLHYGSGGISGTVARPAMRPGQAAELRIDAPDQSIAFDLPADLSRDDGARIEPARVTLSTGAYRPSLRAAVTRGLVADGAAPPDLARAFNAPPTDLDELAVGREVVRGTLRSPDTRGQLRRFASPTTLDTLAEGGWVRWTPPRAPSRGIVDVEFSAPDFDLFALAGRREVLAWANAWAGDAPVGGARVELLWFDGTDASPRVVASARTGGDGVARLRLPEDLVIEGEPGDGTAPMWLLRATHGRGRNTQRAVLPAWQSWQGGTALGEAAPLRAWGVADRPMYRAGDTVRYRLWQRKRSGGRLLRIDAQPVRELRLVDRDQGKTILRWQAMPDAAGGIAGELALPVHLTDGTYCIGTGEDHDVQGSCFFVGTYRAQDLWAEATTADSRVLRDGDRFAVDVEAGYYSGGPAAGIALADVSARLVPLPLSQAFPDYADYTFVDVGGRIAVAGVPLAGIAAPVTGADGRVRIALPVAFDTRGGAAPRLPAFGELRLAAEIRLDEREGTVSNIATTRYTRFDRFVGLRVEPRWLDAASPVVVQGVVIDTEGRALADAPVEVEVHYLDGFADNAASPEPRLLTRCTVPAGTQVACDFPREASGRYRLTARSGDAAPAETVRHVWVGTGPASDQRTARPTLELIEPPASVGAPARVLLTQPHARARVLFVFAGEDAVLDHRVETVEGPTAGFELQTGAVWRGRTTLHAHVRAAAPTHVSNGWRQASPVLALRTELPEPGRDTRAAPLELAFDADTTAPGAQRTLRLRNTGDVPRDVVLTVVDDALRALAAGFLPYFDPLGRYWLGAPAGSRSALAGASFATWSQHRQRWTALRPWPDAMAGDGDENCAAYVLPGNVAACEAAQAVRVPAPGEPPVMFDEPSAMDAVAPPPAPPSPPAPAPVMDIGASVDEPNALDRVMVTGSRIEASPVDTVDVARDVLARDGLDAARDQTLQAIARVRTRFADAALWIPSIRLAPGETREIAVTLPDNLTRWRAIAWSSDADDDFHVAEATVETGLPVEVRLQTPVRLYPGDRSRLAANLRQSGDTPVEAQAALQVDGLDAPLRDARTVALVARGQAAIATEIAPVAPGGLQVIASAETPAGRDAVAAAIEVASPSIRARRLQAGWLGDDALSLELPALPQGADDAHLRVTLQHGVTGLVERWTRDMRDYRHRCWEQILSRAVAAALAIERGDTADWPDAEAAIREALDNAAVFQDITGDFRFFAERIAFDGLPDPRPQVALTAWTVRAFALLRQLGHPVDDRIEGQARAFLADRLVADRVGTAPTARDVIVVNEQAFAAEAVSVPTDGPLDGLFARWTDLSLPARIALAQAMVGAGHTDAADATARLMRQAPGQGPVRVLRTTLDDTRWMGSPMREQCALIDLLRNAGADDDARRALIAGLGDLYSGGVSSVDTQTGAVCLLALRDVAIAGGDAVAVTLQPGAADAAVLALAAGDVQAEWTGALPVDGRLRIAPQLRGATSAGYIAEVDYREDARQARASAVGFSIERRYEVLRGGAWVGLDGADVREGDWLRVTLTVRTSAPRYFVAVTDAVPGGLRPTDLALGAIAGLDLQQVSDTGSGWFATRRLDPRSPRFYAEHLPAGTHALHYFLRAGNGGDYLAAPATAELMYGGGSNARTAAQRVVVGAGMP